MTPEEAQAPAAEVQRRRCETEEVEVKAARGGLPGAGFRQALSAFANRPGGGVIVLGLDEQCGFEPVGVNDPQ